MEYHYNGLVWRSAHGPEALGLLPMMVHADDPRSAYEQLHTNYAHGGGWRPFQGFTIGTKGKLSFLQYPDDPPGWEIARTTLREETIILYEYSWVAIIQPNGSYSIARMD